MKGKRNALVAAALLLVSLPLWAKGTPLALGFGVSDAAGNLGLSLELSSPSFAKDFLIVRAESQVDFLSAYRDNPAVEWEMFSTHRLGLVGIGGWNSETIRLYGEFGGLLVLPSSAFSADTNQFGIYGLFGFEFFFAPQEETPLSYYLEVGTNSLFDTADKLAANPDYYSGFAFRTGLRFYF